MELLSCTVQPSTDAGAVQCGLSAVSPHLIRTGKISAKILMEKLRKIAISNYAMLKEYLDTCA